MAIPVIDLSDLAKGNPSLEEAKAIGKACLDFGFFYVVNHGIAGKLQAKVLEKSRTFFNLPAEKKEEIHRRDGFRGYFRKEEERSIEYGGTDWKEGIYYFSDVKNVPEGRREKVFCGFNPWPREEYVPQFRAVMEEYFRKTQDLGSKLLSCIASSLGIKILCTFCSMHQSNSRGAVPGDFDILREARVKFPNLREIIILYLIVPFWYALVAYQVS